MCRAYCRSMACFQVRGTRRRQRDSSSSDGGSRLLQHQRSEAGGACASNASSFRKAPQPGCRYVE